MKLINNMLSATALAATAEALALGVKSGLDAQTMIDVLNAGSGATTASLDKFPRAVITGTFDYGFATGLMVKDLRLYLEEAHDLSMTLSVSESVEQQWGRTLDREGAESDFTCIVKPIEDAAGVEIRAQGLGQ
jgi:3-hydroxyisobutyrate dehydrogenase-like beta-hydroxyacid dehydrogenase